MLVVGDHGKLVLAFPGAQDKDKDENHPNILDGSANVILEDSAFSSYCLLETDKKSR